MNRPVIVSNCDENEEGRKSLNFKPTLSIRRLKDNPDVDKPLSLSFLIWALLRDQKGESEMSFVVSLRACEFDSV
jgi:hypothetical protein